jgi:hypothetical protein
MSSIAGGPRLSVNSAAPTATTRLVGQFWGLDSDRVFEFFLRQIANCSRLPRDGRYVAADSPAPVPPSDADLLDIQGPLRRTDPTNFRPRKQKKPGGLPASVVGIGR